MKIPKKKLVESVMKNLSMYTEAITFTPKKGDDTSLNFEDYKLPANGSCKGEILTGSTGTILVGSITFTNYNESSQGKKFDTIRYHSVLFGKTDISNGQDEAKNLVDSIYNKSKVIIKNAVKQAEKYKSYVPKDLVKSTLDDIVSLLENEFGMYVYVRSNDYGSDYEDLTAEFERVFGTKYKYKF